MRVTVLCGGPGDERAISLKSGAAVADGLRAAGHDVFVSDIFPDELSALDRPADVIFPVLHGEFGESGDLQEQLEARRLVFVGSGSAASRLGINKVLTKQRWTAAGLHTPQYLLVTPTNRSAIDEFPLPCIVKPVDSGSSVGVFRCDTREQARDAIAKTLAQRSSALVEQFIAGIELTIGLLEDRPLPPIRIYNPRGGLFDFDAKYQSAETEHRFDTTLPDAVLARCIKDSTRAYHLLGCRDLGRIDLIVDAAGVPWLLEINTLPGFTSHSLLPHAAQQAGISFPQVVDRLVNAARTRAQAASRLGKAV
jgi:D-alanine-D-alanine ligase